MYAIKVESGNRTYSAHSLGAASVETNDGHLIRFTDIGNKRLGNNGKSWGACITFQNRVWEFRYEGGGNLEIVHQNNTLQFNPINGVIEEVTK